MVGGDLEEEQAGKGAGTEYRLGYVEFTMPERSRWRCEVGS